MPPTLKELNRRLEVLEGESRQRQQPLATDLHDLGFVPYCLVTRATSTQDITAGATTAVQFNATTYDPLRMHDNTTNPERLTIVRAGWYFCVANVTWESFAADKYSTMWVNAVQGGTNHYGGARSFTSAASALIQNAFLPWPMNVGDYFTAAVNHNDTTEGDNKRAIQIHNWTSGGPSFAAVFMVASGLPTDI